MAEETKGEARPVKMSVEPSVSSEDLARQVALEEGNKRDAQAGFVVPRDFVKLPSKGKVYPPNSSLHNAEDVEVRQMTASEEDILTSRSLIRSGKAIDLVIQNCLMDKSVNVDDLIAGDKNAIMIALRVSGYGKDYSIDTTCPSCSEETTFAFDLSSLKMRTLDVDPVSEGDNKFDFKTPSGRDIEFKILTSGEQKSIADSQSKIKRMSGQEVDRNVTTRFKHQILSVDGDSKPAQIQKYSDMMPVSDSRAFRTFVDEIEPDIIMKQMFSCPSCGNSQEVDLPITVEFFWPE